MRGVGRLKYSVFDERLKNKTLLSRKIVKSRATDDFILICQVLLMQTVPGFDLFEPIDVLVLGVGNILWADEGFGVRAVEAFNARYKLPEKTKVADGGTLGMYLLELIGSTKDLLLFDCADLQEKPGTLKLLTNDEVKFWSATKISPHQTGMNEVLALAELQGHAPERIAVVAIQPEILQDYGGSLTPACESALARAVEIAKDVLTGWGYKVVRRSEGETVAPLGDASLNKRDYETQRPSEKEAPREGDIRFFPKFQ